MKQAQTCAPLCLKPTQDICFSGGDSGDRFTVRSLVNEDRAAFFSMLLVHPGLPGERALAVQRTRSHLADQLAVLICHRVAQVRHAHPGWKAEAQHLALALLFLRQESCPPYEPRLVGLDESAEACIRGAELQWPGQFLAVERQPGFDAQRVAGAEADRPQAVAFAGLE